MADRTRLTTTRIQRKSQYVHAFTLVELLVVVAIISLLIAILLPAVVRAREAALRVTCLSNQRQIGIGLIMYAGVYGGYPHQRQSSSDYFPPGYPSVSLIGGPRLPGISPQGCWPTTILGWEADALFEKGFGVKTIRLASEILITMPQLFACPTVGEKAGRDTKWPNGTGVSGWQNAADDSKYTWAMLGYFYLGRAYSWTECDPAGSPSVPTLSPMKLTSKSSWALLSCEVMSISGSWALGLTSHLNSRKTAPAGANHLFNDGHAEWVPWHNGLNYRCNQRPNGPGAGHDMYWRRSTDTP